MDWINTNIKERNNKGKYVIYISADWWPRPNNNNSINNNNVLKKYLKTPHGWCIVTTEVTCLLSYTLLTSYMTASQVLAAMLIEKKRLNKNHCPNTMHLIEIIHCNHLHVSSFMKQYDLTSFILKVLIHGKGLWLVSLRQAMCARLTRASHYGRHRHCSNVDTVSSDTKVS